MFVGCFTSQQHTSVSQGRTCSICTRCHTEVADQTFHLTRSQHTDTRPTSPSADPTTPGAWQGSHWSADFEVTGMTRPQKNPGVSGAITQKFSCNSGEGENQLLINFCDCDCFLGVLVNRLVGLLVGCLTSQQHSSVYIIRYGSAVKIVRAATLRWECTD